LGVALGSAAVVGSTSMFLHWSAFGSRSGEEGVLRLHYVGDATGRDGIATAIRKHCGSFHLSAARQSKPGGPEEFVYDVNLRNPDAGDALVRDLVSTGGVSGVSLLPLARVGES
jgi:hypothetical protein